MFVEFHIPNCVSNEKTKCFSEIKKSRKQLSSIFTLSLELSNLSKHQDHYLYGLSQLTTLRVINVRTKKLNMPVTLIN